MIPTLFFFARAFGILAPVPGPQLPAVAVVWTPIVSELPCKRLAVYVEREVGGPMVPVFLQVTR